MRVSKQSRDGAYERPSNGEGKGLKKTIQAIRKNTLPNIAHELPMLAMQKPIAEMMNKIQPNRLIMLFDIIWPYYAGFGLFRNEQPTQCAHVFHQSFCATR